MLTHVISTRKCTALNKRASYADQIRILACLAIFYNFKLFLPPLLLLLFFIPTDNVWLLSSFPIFFYFVSFSSKVCVCNTTVRGGISQG